MKPFTAAVRKSLRFKVTLVVLTITGMALLLSTTALLIYELRSYREAWIEDLTTQAQLVARSSAPALSFDDRGVAQENLRLLQLRPQIAAAAVYDLEGRLFASYLRVPDAQGLLPARPGRTGYAFAGDRLELFHPIIHPAGADEPLGTVYLRADYDLRQRVPAYLLILLAVMAASMAVAALVTARLQRTITRPILDITNVAREVMQKRDFSLRAPRTTSDEVAVLVDAFNGMLAEVELRTDALEQSNEQLFNEMAQRRRAEEALTRAAQAKDEFLATLAHELRNPLAPIGNAVEILRRIGDGEPALRTKALDIMSRQLRQMVRLIDDLLDVSRITTGKLLLHTERVDLQAVLRSALEIAGPGIEARSHALVLDLPPEPLPVDGDATRLAQVFANLLNNASKYTDPGGRIELSLRPAGSLAVVRVSDNGMGIAPEVQARIFEMFVQLNTSLERGRAGLGVGLSLARRLIEMHGGTISVSSEGPGRGSCFEVRLPRASTQAPGALPVGLQALASQAAPQRRILVADDNVDFATSLAHILESLGHQVVIAHDGEEALAMAEQHAPEVAFLDIGMPKRNGYELATALRERANADALLLVAITGWGQARDRELARAAGFDHHLVKPIELQQILSLVGVHQPL